MCTSESTNNPKKLVGDDVAKCVRFYLAHVSPRMATTLESVIAPLLISAFTAVEKDIAAAVLGDVQFSSESVVTDSLTRAIIESQRDFGTDDCDSDPFLNGGNGSKRSGGCHTSFYSASDSFQVAGTSHLDSLLSSVRYQKGLVMEARLELSFAGTTFLENEMKRLIGAECCLASCTHDLLFAAATLRRLVSKQSHSSSVVEILRSDE